MADSTLPWLATLGVIVGLLGCCLLYALWQVTNAKDEADKLQIRLTHMEKQQESMSENLESAMSKQKDAEAEEDRRLDTVELLVKLRKLEKTVTEQDDRIDTLQRNAAELAASPIPREKEVVVTAVPEPTAGLGKHSNDVKQIYEEILRTVQGNSSGEFGSPRAGVVTHSAFRGGGSLPDGMTNPEASFSIRAEDSQALAYTLPPPFTVYLCTPGLFRGTNYVKRLHSVCIDSSGGDTDGDVSLSFALPDQEPDIRLPMSDVTTIAPKSGRMDFDDSECVSVTITKRLRASTATHSHRLFSRNERDPHETVNDGAETQLVFTATVSPQIDAWIMFMQEHFPSKVVTKGLL